MLIIHTNAVAMLTPGPWILSDRYSFLSFQGWPNQCQARDLYLIAEKRPPLFFYLSGSM